MILHHYEAGNLDISAAGLLPSLIAGDVVNRKRIKIVEAMTSCS